MPTPLLGFVHIVLVEGYVGYEYIVSKECGGGYTAIYYYYRRFITYSVHYTGGGGDEGVRSFLPLYYTML